MYLTSFVLSLLSLILAAIVLRAHRPINELILNWIESDIEPSEIAVNWAVMVIDEPKLIEKIVKRGGICDHILNNRSRIRSHKWVIATDGVQIPLSTVDVKFILKAYDGDASENRNHVADAILPTIRKRAAHAHARIKGIAPPVDPLEALTEKMNSAPTQAWNADELRQALDALGLDLVPKLTSEHSHIR